MRRTISPVAVAMLLLAAGSGRLPGASDDADGQSGIHAPVTSREVEQLKTEISDAARSSIEAIGEYHTETGDLNNRVDMWRYGGQVNYRRSGGKLFYLRGVGTSYLTTGRFLDERGLNFTGGMRTALSESATLQFEGGATRFSTGTTTVNGLGSLEIRASDKSTLYLNGSRTNVEETLLSAAGIRPATGPFAGKVVGLVMDNRGTFGARYRLTQRFDVFGQGGAGVREGRNIESNFLKAASAGAGFNIVAIAEDNPVSLLRASYGLDYFGFDKNLLGYGGTSLVAGHGHAMPIGLIGSDGISPTAQPGLGGYFSPQQYVSNVGRIELQGRLHPQVDYSVSGFVGGQDYTGSKVSRVNGFVATVNFRLSDRYSLPITYLKDNFGPFTQQSLFFRLVARL